MTDTADPERVRETVARAEQVKQRAQTVNRAQYAHGISSALAEINFILSDLENGRNADYRLLNRLHDYTMKLAGYLYALREGI